METDARTGDTDEAREVWIELAERDLSSVFEWVNWMSRTGELLSPQGLSAK